ncbi:leucine zipper domain-containing protein [Streptomyces sp. NPDC057690]|uniref:leucine zipper domain-containing protein n=1 Tax=Streptomyces sp. NPDC057690 TaxID=3346214 RepID=UPI003684567F
MAGSITTDHDRSAQSSGPKHVAGHRNAPLTPEGRLRLRLRIEAGHPIARVAAEAGISRRCLGKWHARRRAHGQDGLLGRSSRPAVSPARTAEDVADPVEALRRRTEYGPARLAADLQRLHRITLAPATVHRVLGHLPQPLAVVPQQLTIEDAMGPTS